MFVDDAQLRQLHDRYSRDVFSRAYHEVGHLQDAEDLTEETFSRIRGQDIRKNPRAYLRTVVGNVIKGYWAKKKRRPLSLDGRVDRNGVTIDLTQDLLDPRTLPAETKRRELREHVRTAVARLPAEKRRVIVLRHFHVPPLSWEAIAARLHCSPPTVREKYKRAIQVLGRKLTRDLED